MKHCQGPPRPCTVEYLNRNVTNGQLLQHISKSTVVDLCTVKAKNEKYIYKKEVCRAS